METEVLKNFIVLEGLDGAGTTTQLNNLSELLTGENFNVFKTFEPTDGCVGRLIRDVLQKKYTLDPKTICKLYSSDRYEHIYGTDGIYKQLEKSDYVICDRYLFSSLAYQAPGCGFEFVMDNNKEYPLPEYLFFISVPVDVCQSRIDSRGDEKELFEAKEYQLQVLDNYEKALESYKNSKMKIVVIDGTKTPDEITKEIVSIIR